MKLGYNTNGLAHHRWQDALSLIAETGYQSVAVTVDHHCLNPLIAPNRFVMPNDVVPMRDLLAQFGLSSVVESGARFLLNPRVKHEPTLLSRTLEERTVRFDFLKRCIDIAAEIGADAMSFWSGCWHRPVENIETSQTESRDEIWDRLISGCQQLTAYAETKNMPLAFEPEPGMFIESFADYQQLCEQVDHPLFGLTIDIGHVQCIEDGTIANHLRQWKDQLFNVHIEDMVRGVHDHLRFGDGEIDFPPIIKTLQEIGYTGGVHVELSRHSHMAPEVLRESFCFLQSLLD